MASRSRLVLKALVHIAVSVVISLAIWAVTSLLPGLGADDQLRSLVSIFAGLAVLFWMQRDRLLKDADPNSTRMTTLRTSWMIRNSQKKR